MTRRICIVFTLALSFTMMFLSPSLAEEITVKVTVPISETRVPLSETRVPLSETTGVEISLEDQLTVEAKAKCQDKKECRTKNNIVGYWQTTYCCTPCDNLRVSSTAEEQ
jgi:hypothetical protein